MDALCSVQAGFYKRTLGIAKSVSTDGILWETGSIDIRDKALTRTLMYCMRCAKDLSPPLVALCYREQLLQGITWVHKPWVLHIRDILMRYNCENLWVGEGLNSRTVYTSIKRKIEIASRTTLLQRCALKKSLQCCNNESGAIPKYMELCAREQRSGILWYRLGGWLIYKWKKDINGTSQVVCPLCDRVETAMHILAECSSTAKHRIGLDNEVLKNIKHGSFASLDDPVQLHKIGTYLNTVRTLRNKALQKVNCNL
jgi:hypothetical protein